MSGRYSLRIPAMAATRSDDDGHPRSIATQAVGLFTRLTAMGQVGVFLSHRFASSEIEAVRLMDDPVEDRIGDAPAAKIHMPVGNGEL